MDAGNRTDPSWAGVQPPYVVGYELAGRIHAVRDGAAGWAGGDPVWGLLPVRGTRWATYAELVGHGTLAASLPVVREGAGPARSGAGGRPGAGGGPQPNLHGLPVRPSRAVLGVLAAAAADGSLRRVVDQVLDLADAAAAHRRVESGHGQGKVVLRVAG